MADEKHLARNYPRRNKAMEQSGCHGCHGCCGCHHVHWHWCYHGPYYTPYWGGIYQQQGYQVTYGATQGTSGVGMMAYNILNG